MNGFDNFLEAATVGADFLAIIFKENTVNDIATKLGTSK